MATEIVHDTKDFLPLEAKYGDRFVGWHVLKTELRVERLPLGMKELTYPFTICDYNYRFLMPERLEFAKGGITYSGPERILGIFRFPLDENGKFYNTDSITGLSEEQVKAVLLARKPVIFEAFRIPQFGFEFPNLTEKDLEEIENISDQKTASDIKFNHAKILDEKERDVIGKIEVQPNFLLILKNMLNEETKDFNKVSRITNKIINKNEIG